MRIRINMFCSRFSVDPIVRTIPYVPLRFRSSALHYVCAPVPTYSLTGRVRLGSTAPPTAQAIGSVPTTNRIESRRTVTGCYKYFNRSFGFVLLALQQTKENFVLVP